MHGLRVPSPGLAGVQSFIRPWLSFPNALSPIAYLLHTLWNSVGGKSQDKSEKQV